MISIPTCTLVKKGWNHSSGQSMTKICTHRTTHDLMYSGDKGKSCTSMCVVGDHTRYFGKVSRPRRNTVISLVVNVFWRELALWYLWTNVQHRILGNDTSSQRDFMTVMDIVQVKFSFLSQQKYDNLWYDDLLDGYLQMTTRQIWNDPKMGMKADKCWLFVFLLFCSIFKMSAQAMYMILCDIHMIGLINNLHHCHFSHNSNNEQVCGADRRNIAFANNSFSFAFISDNFSHRWWSFNSSSTVGELTM